MSAIKVIEVLSESDVSWEDAVKQALAKVSKTIHNVKSVYIKDHGVKFENGEIKSYLMNAKVNFLVNSEKQE